MGGRPRRAVPETTFEVFEVGSTPVAMVADVVNERAWIQSTVAVPVER